mmetsp:Transcript_22884/g.35198  ORF Transcript_22884/g.35198 Transcript_22884/m.35198 type:complete len:92 (+) Transcript_22884:325-600(+)
MKKQWVFGCDDAHMSAYSQFLSMLKGEREHYKKIKEIIKPEEEAADFFDEPAEGIFKVKLPQAAQEKARREIAEELIFKAGLKLKQTSTTI